ncbi:EF-hand domain-containing protein [Streptomyces anulatus]
MSLAAIRTLELFSVFDTDNSGWINESDLPSVTDGQSAVKAQEVQNVRDLMTGLIKAADTDKDGRVSRQEIRAYLDNSLSTKTLDELPAPIRDFTTKTFALMDTNKAGSVSYEEFDAYLKARTTTPDSASDFKRIVRSGSKFKVEDLHRAAFAFFTEPEDSCPELWLRAAVSV